MKFNILIIPPFGKQLIKLSKKYPSLKTEFAGLINSLELNPMQGTFIGHHCYKIRLSIHSKNRGKRGGARVITHIVISETIVYLLTIYDKSEKDDLSNKELLELLSKLQ